MGIRAGHTSRGGRGRECIGGQGPGLPPALGKKGHQALVEVLAQGHSGQAGNAQDLAGAPGDAAAAAKPRRGNLAR